MGCRPQHASVPRSQSTRQVKPGMSKGSTSSSPSQRVKSGACVAKHWLQSTVGLVAHALEGLSLAVWWWVWPNMCALDCVWVTDGTAHDRCVVTVVVATAVSMDCGVCSSNSPPPRFSSTLLALIHASDGGPSNRTKRHLTRSAQPRPQHIRQSHACAPTARRHLDAVRHAQGDSWPEAHPGCVSMAPALGPPREVELGDGGGGGRREQESGGHGHHVRHYGCVAGGGQHLQHTGGRQAGLMSAVASWMGRVC